MDDFISMSISVDSPSDETLNRGPLALLLWRQYELPFGVDIVRFSIFNFQFFLIKACSLAELKSTFREDGKNFLVFCAS